MKESSKWVWTSSIMGAVSALLYWGFLIFYANFFGMPLSMKAGAFLVYLGLFSAGYGVRQADVEDLIEDEKVTKELDEISKRVKKSGKKERKNRKNKKQN